MNTLKTTCYNCHQPMEMGYLNTSHDTEYEIQHHAGVCPHCGVKTELDLIIDFSACPVCTGSVNRVEHDSGSVLLMCTVCDWENYRYLPVVAKNATSDDEG